MKRIVDKNNDKEYAGKFLPIRGIRAAERALALEEIMDEVRIVSRLKHENIVRLYGYFLEKSRVVIVMELMLGGPLLDEVREFVEAQFPSV